MKMYQEFSNKLNKGQKITLVSFGEFGFLGMTQTTFEEVTPKNHYQNCPEDMIGVQLIHKPKRKRTAYRKIISYNNSVLVYDGWVDIDMDSIQYNQIDKYTRETKYSCFDSRYMTDVESAIKVKPIIKINC